MYRGRFAPSPTGPLHFGSLVAACASYLEARARQGEWLVRMEDLDRPRCRAEHAAAILESLTQFGFVWDGPIVYQSARTDFYDREFTRLGGLVYPCCCSRKEIAGHGESRYPGTCRDGMAAGKPIRAYRVRVPDERIEFTDQIQGVTSSNLNEDCGDFVLRRASDSIYSYQLAVVADDQDQGITDVVRGADLLDSTPRQIYLQRLLGYSTPRYAHIPVALGADGEKLSKQTLAPSLDGNAVERLLVEAWEFLGQNPPADLSGRSREAIWQWAISNWDARKIPQKLK